MNRQSTPPDDSWENDAVWKLLDQATPVTASARFADDVVRAARLSRPGNSWWLRLLSPAPLAGLAAAAAAVAISFSGVFTPAARPATEMARIDSRQADDIQEIAETETLIAAADHLDAFSDNELVSLIGF